MEKEISAGIIIYRKTNKGPKFLLLYHGHNYWNFPKGKLETGQKFIEGGMVQEREKSFHAAIREVREETGLGRNDLKFFGLFRASEQFTFWRQNKKIFKTVIFYLAETPKKDIKLSSEHEGFGWFSYKEAVKTLGNRKGNQIVLKQAFDALQKPIGAIVGKRTVC
ncbi:hypothetical protein COV23_02065 [Candidatus Wolfebacteria bacterium CG10_big_fil_rev_8_21_14_0_10_31_9]|uniref:Bis(5'-nucleosyl)-tetraphosphatase [asymmetrical] n=1 Tax=Candidatus Wolfebacteria bacterium CG10_big_fil_rev_8_21_14_0_10_31_9 TaxID=1975070 RepID=A0A2H0RC30_9BACT|nr:MAG: hypothetical protein COV23_02065 [Candidatus Wolfebacteria bacterium CG10_big_fil_rev_8_21_14_0_10_31_9]